MVVPVIISPEASNRPRSSKFSFWALKLFPKFRGGGGVGGGRNSYFYPCRCEVSAQKQNFKLRPKSLEFSFLAGI